MLAVITAVALVSLVGAQKTVLPLKGGEIAVNKGPSFNSIILKLILLDAYFTFVFKLKKFLYLHKIINSKSFLYKYVIFFLEGVRCS